MEHIRSIVNNLFKLREQLARRRKALVPMAAVVVFVTTYALILPAVTMDNDTASSTPGVEVAKTAADDTSASTAATNDSSGEQGEASGGSQDNSGDNKASQDSQKANGSDESDNANDNGDKSADDNANVSDTVNGSEGKVRAQTKDGAYKVTASYGTDAGLPDGTKLQVKKLKDTSDSYQHAKDAVTAAKKKQDTKFKQENLGFKALDISFVGADGTKIEPQGKVDIKIEAKDLPQKAAENGIIVQHVVKKTDLQSAAKDDTDKQQAIKKAPGAHGLVAQSVGGKTKVDGDQNGTAEFSVNSFSVFTITWDKSATDNTRLGNITVNYVDADNLEVNVDEDSGLTSAEMLKYTNGIVKMTDLANKSDGTSRVSGYTFDQATIESRKGETITGLMLKQGTEDRKESVWDASQNLEVPVMVTVTTYKLYYTTDDKVDENSNWVEYKDSTSENSANNVDVFLKYKKHTKEVDVYYTDLAGKRIEGTPIKKYDVSDWQNGTHNFLTDAQSYTPDGYVAFPKGNSPANVNTIESPRWWINNDQTKNNTDNYILYATNSFITKSGTTNNFGLETFRDVRGYAIDTMTYNAANKSLNIQRAHNSVRDYTATSSALPASDTEPYKVYIMYRKKITIHDVDANGNELDNPRTNDNWYVGFDPKAWNSHYAGSTLVNSSLGTPSSVYVKDGDRRVQADANNFDIAWNFSGAASYNDINQSNNGSTFGTIKEGVTGKSDGTGSWNTRIKTGSGTSDSDYTTLNGQLITDVYMVYDNAHSVKVHHVDAQGNRIADDTTTAVTSGGALDPNGLKANVKGYTYDSAHIESATGSPFTSITYNKADGDDGAWTSTVTNGDQTVTPANPLTDEIWLVYNKTGKNLTIHYQYTGTDGTNHDAYYLNDGDTTHQTEYTKTVSGDGETQLVSDPLNNGAYVDNIKDGNVYRSAESGETGDQKLIYMASHIGDPDGPLVNSVSLNSKGELTYHSQLSITANPATNERNVTRWVGSNDSGSQEGRQLVVKREDDGTLTLQDSQNGTMRLNLRNDRGSSSGSPSATVNEDYVATFHGEHTTTEYKVTPSEQTAQDGTGRTVTTYTIEVRDSIVSTATDIYQMYIDGNSQSDDKIWINNDIKYSGLFRTGLSDHLSGELASADKVTDSEGNVTNARDVTYEWHRIQVPEGTAIPTDMSKVSDIDAKESGDAPEYPLVTRKQTGDHYNISSSSRTATWLDVEAEEGDTAWTYGTKRAYYVKLTYKKGGETHVLRSVPVTINYYGQLENGSFETPDASQAKYSWDGKTANPTTGYLSNDVNGRCGAPGGIWKTTAPSDKPAGQNGYQADIEIVNTRNSGFRDPYNWQGSDGAKDGSQFAELNAEGAGALYQDVITHPNEQLSYWFSHRARGTKGPNKYDSMYLVIMPTKLAMTSGDNNTELRTQDELEKFIQEHGGYDTNTATDDEDRITYSDSKNGILIRKVSSSNMSWHDINVVNGYTAKGGLTRFFFVAGGTAAGVTKGNFLDNVGFSQALPKPEGFNLTVSKTFTGLSRAQVAAMANNAKDDDGNIISNPFTMTITNANAYRSTERSNDALNNAKLQFRQSSGASSGLEAVAVDSAGDDLLSKSGNTGVVRINDDGTVTITWTFTNQPLSVSGNETQDQTYNYKVTESKGAGDSATAPNVDGYTRTSTVAANTGVQWVQYYAATYKNGTFESDSRTPRPVDIDTSRSTVAAQSTNLIAAQVYNGAKTGYVVWTPEKIEPDVKRAIVDHINTLDWTHNGVSDKAYLTDTEVTENGSNKTIAANVAFVYGQAGTSTQPFSPVHDEGNSESVKSFLNDNQNMAMIYNVGSNGLYGLRFIDTVREESLNEDTHARSVNIGEGTQAQMRFTNSYREKNTSQMTVQKVFSGVTQYTVENDLLKKGYYIQLTKTHDSDGREITGTKPTLQLNQTSGSNANVTYDIDDDKTTGKVTLTWHIRDLAPDSDTGANARMGGPGIYTVKEVGYAPTEEQTTHDNNTLTQIVINGKRQEFKGSDGKLKKETIDGQEVACVTQTGIHVGNVGSGADTTVPSITDSGSDSSSTLVTQGITPNTAVKFEHDPNIAVARLQTHEGQPAYLVWTRDAIGANVRQAIINFINTQAGFGVRTGEGTDNDDAAATARDDNVRFYNGFGDGSGQVVFDQNYPEFKLTFNPAEDTATFGDDNPDENPHWVRYLTMNYKVIDGAQYDGMTNNDTEVRVANSYDPIVKIRKTNTPSGAAQATPLQGGVFRVYKKDANGNKQYYLTTSTPTDAQFGAVDDVDKKDADGKYVNMSDSRVGSDSTRKDETKALSFTTGDDGTISIGALSGNQAQPTHFWLEEVEAPSGYNRVNDIEFVLNEDGTIELVGPNNDKNEPTYSNDVGPAKVTWNDPYYTITVKDESSTILPNTGGPGDLLFRVAGIALVAAALAGAYLLRRRGYWGRQ